MRRSKSEGHNSKLSKSVARWGIGGLLKSNKSANEGPGKKGSGKESKGKGILGRGKGKKGIHIASAQAAFAREQAFARTAGKVQSLATLKGKGKKGKTANFVKGRTDTHLHLDHSRKKTQQPFHTDRY